MHFRIQLSTQYPSQHSFFYQKTAGCQLVTMKFVTFSVTIPYVMKLELCPLITTLFLISSAWSIQLTRPYVQKSLNRTLTLAERSLPHSIPLSTRFIRVKPQRRQTSLASTSTCGGSTNGCWVGNYSIETDTDTSWPNTGRVVEYNLTITNSTCAPDGVKKSCLIINGQFPGPTIQANWGDIVKVNLNNQMQDNGTSMHWHGIRQFQTNDQDGVNGLTECPLAPGQTRTYEWQATTYGTTWYHSHFAAQYGDGILGPIVINGPSTAGYDYDMGPTMISELYKLTNGTEGSTTADSIITTQGPLTDVPDNVLFNGINVNAEGQGTRLEYEFVPGARHLMRFVNSGVDNHYKVGIDGHMMEVVSIDLTPVKPYMAQYVSLGVGQRFEAVVTANASVGAYWMRAILTSCASNKYDGFGNQNAIIRYMGATEPLPTTKAVAPPVDCLDEPAEKTIPFVAKSVDSSTFNPYHLPIASPQQVTTNEEGRVFRWTIGKTTQNVNWSSPILQRFVQGDTTVNPEDNLIGVNQTGYAYWYLQNNFFEAHPIHMHGNDLSILATGPGQWSENATELNFANPMRRDTFMMPAGGYAVLAFSTDNPGIWLLHCHIAWHASEGLSTSLYVRKDAIKVNKVKATTIQDQCKTWDSYVGGYGVYAPQQALGNGTSSGAMGGVSAAIAAAAGGARYQRLGSGVKRSVE